MNILFINRLLGTFWGGGENFDFHLAKALHEMGHRPLFLTGHPLGSKPPGPIGGIDVVSFETPYLRRYMYKLAGKVRRLPGLAAELDLYLFRQRARLILNTLLSKRSIDVVQVLGMPSLAGDLARGGMPVVLRFPGPPAWFQSRRLRRFHAIPNTAIVSDGDTVRYFQSQIGISIHDVPPGVDDHIFQPMDQALRLQKRMELGIPPDEFVLITVGRLIVGKGHDFLLHAVQPLAAANPKLRLLVLGDGALRACLETTARQLGIERQVHFTGHLPKANVAQYLGISDLFCLFSDYENYSNAVLEAMSCGLPVLASRVGGFPMQIEDGRNGYLVDLADQTRFRQLIGSLSANPDLRRRLSDGAREFVSRFSWRATAAQSADIYQQVLGRQFLRESASC
jgi:glycosyltransferase involved in cell wall biosynthesis